MQDVSLISGYCEDQKPLSVNKFKIKDLPFFQRKLAINQSDVVYEHEAEKVMRLIELTQPNSQ